MKKGIVLVLLLSLLVGCTQAPKKDETMSESTSETMMETQAESTSETMMETQAEATETQAEMPTEVSARAVAVKDSVAVVKAGDKEFVVTLEAKNVDALIQGHKYDFVVDAAQLEAGEVSVENAEMLGKAIPFGISTETAKLLLEKVEGIVLVDTRTSEEFSAGNKEGSINLFEAEAVTKESLSGLDKNSIVIAYGNPELNSNILTAIYKTTGASVVFDAGVSEELTK